MADYDADLRKLLEEGLYALVGLSVFTIFEARRRLRAAGESSGAGTLAEEVRRSLLDGTEQLERLVREHLVKQAGARAGVVAREVLGALVRRIT